MRSRTLKYLPIGLKTPFNHPGISNGLDNLGLNSLFRKLLEGEGRSAPKVTAVWPAN